MKKIIALVTMFVFIAALSGMVYAQIDYRSPAEKLEAARAYLKLLDQKIIRLRNAGKMDLVTKMQAEKKGTLARMKAWKAEAEGAPGTPVAPTPPPPPVTVRPAAAPSAGLFGLGLNTGYTVGYVMSGSNSAITGRADLILDDPLSLGSLIGLSEKDVNWKVGLGGLSGKGTNDASQNAIAIFVDGILNVSPDLLGGIESYLGGDFNYVVYRSGNWGGAVYYGIKGDIGLGGKSYIQLSYDWIRASSTTLKGLGINVGTELVL